MSRFSQARAPLFFCAAVLCFGCGDSENSGSEDGSSGEAGVPGTGGSSGSGVGGSAGTSGGGGGTIAGAGGSSGAAGSGGGGDEQPLVPLITGHVSNFRFLPLDSSMPMLETCADPFTEVGETDTIQGVTGVRYLSFCTDTTVLLTGSGDSLTAHQINPATGTMLGAVTEYIHSPVEDGESWQTSSGTYAWAEVTQPLTVPAGSFADCWERLAPPDITTFTYCRGVGLVVGVSMSSNWRIELVSKNF